jgi:uncharacterized membrane protein HdeD (DUF308 family)
MGVLGVAVAVVTVLSPAITALSLLYLTAFWAISLGAVQVVTAIRLRREIAGELWLVVGGLLTILFGIFIAVFPGSGLLSLVWIVGAWAIVFGITNLILAWRLRGLHHEILGARVVRSAR